MERQELFCHNCRKYVQFLLDTEIDGNHVIKCPNCGHEHCRVVKNGVVTEDRWDSRNGPTIQVSRNAITFSSSSTSSNVSWYVYGSTTSLRT